MFRFSLLVSFFGLYPSSCPLCLCVYFSSICVLVFFNIVLLLFVYLYFFCCLFLQLYSDHAGAAVFLFSQSSLSVAALKVIVSSSRFSNNFVDSSGSESGSNFRSNSAGGSLYIFSLSPTNLASVSTTHFS